MTDIHLHRARLFFRESQYHWDSPAADLAAAEKLINECGSHRRDDELADAKLVILGQYKRLRQRRLPTNTLGPRSRASCRQRRTSARHRALTGHLGGL